MKDPNSENDNIALEILGEQIEYIGDAIVKCEWEDPVELEDIADELHSIAYQISELLGKNAGEPWSMQTRPAALPVVSGDSTDSTK
jgi:hypothetical protein